MTMTNDVHAALKGYAVQSVCITTSRNGKGHIYQVTIGSAGRNMNGTRKFRAGSIETLRRQVEKVYGPVTESDLAFVEGK